MNLLCSDKFKDVRPVEMDEIFRLARRAREVKGPHANLVMGVYRNQEGYPAPLQCIRKAEKIIYDKNMDYEYLLCGGYKPFVDAAVNLLYGDTVDPENIAAVQTVSGTGALSLCAFFLSRIMDNQSVPIYFSNPTWANHHSIFIAAGWENIGEYRYYDSQTRALDFAGYKEDIINAPCGSIFVVQMCAHNPTGVDPSPEQWEELVELFAQKDHLVIMDCAYMGWASGDMEEDAFPVRLFAQKKLQLICAQSFSKNMGLYNTRLGVLSVLLHSSEKRHTVEQNLEMEARHFYTCPPAHGARLAHLVLTDNTLRREWVEELRSMAERIQSMRQLVYDDFQRLGTPGTWEHVLNQKGMFTFLGIPPEQCQYCQDHNVFILTSTRVCVAALTPETVPLFTHAVDASFSNSNK